VVTETTKKLREPIAIGLMAVAVLYFVSGISLLFKSRDDIGFDFSGRAALDGHVFADPVVVISLAVAVLLVTSWGEASRDARTIVLAALVIGALCLVFAVVSWVASLSSEQVSAYGGVNGAGRIVGIFLGLAQISFLALAVTYVATVFQSFPKSVRATQQWDHQQWGQQQWGQQPQWQQQQWSQPPPQQGWGQQPQQWGQPPQQQQAWSEPQQQWGQPQQQAWGEAPGNAPPPGSGWGGPASAPPVQSNWGQTAEQPGWTPPSDPTPSAWSAPETSSPSPAHAAWSEPEQPDMTSAARAAADDDGAVEVVDADREVSQDDDTNGDEDGGRAGSEETSESDSGWWRPSSS
jgi:hypothetical protein